MLHAVLLLGLLGMYAICDTANHAVLVYISNIWGGSGSTSLIEMYRLVKETLCMIN